MIYKTELTIKWGMLRYLCVITHAIQTGCKNSDYAFFALKFETCGKQNKLKREFTNGVILSDRDYLKV